MSDRIASVSRALSYVFAVAGLGATYVYYIFGPATLGSPDAKVARAGFELDPITLIVISFVACAIFWLLAVILRSPTNHA